MCVCARAPRKDALIIHDEILQKLTEIQFILYVRVCIAYLRRYNFAVFMEREKSIFKRRGVPPPFSLSRRFVYSVSFITCVEPVFA